MDTHLTYNDKKYEILGHIEHGNGTLSVDLKPAPELPPEPPEGITLFDRGHRPHYRDEHGEWRDVWGNVRNWNRLLYLGPLHAAVIAPGIEYKVED